MYALQNKGKLKPKWLLNEQASTNLANWFMQTSATSCPNRRKLPTEHTSMSFSQKTRWSKKCQYRSIHPISSPGD